MKVSYVDSSALVAVMFKESAWRGMLKPFKGFSRLVSAALCEAEMLAVCRSEEMPQQAQLSFISLDSAQRLAAQDLGFTVVS